MKAARILTILVLALDLMVFPAEPSGAEPVGTAFTYQGRLIDANVAADGLYDFQFKLFDANSDGNQLGTDVNKLEVDVIDGYFTVDLDFGGVYDGNERWLDIGVRPGELEDPNSYTTLSPRQEVTPTPYALYADGSDWNNLDNIPADIMDGDDNTQLTEGEVDSYVANNGYISSWYDIPDIPAGFKDGIDNTGDSDWTISGSDMYSVVSGNIGIGTSSPETNLHIYEGAGGGSNPEAFSPLAIESDKQAYINIITPTTVEGGILFSDNQYAPGAFAYSHSDNKMKFYTGGAVSPRVVIDSSGRVGIGTTSPTTLMHISKDATVAPSTHPSTKMIIEDGDSDAYLQIMAPAANTRALLFGESGSGGQTNDGMIGYEKNNGMRFWVDRSNNNLIPLILQMDGDVIMNEGNVGIGTSSPSEQLEVDGNIETSGDYKYSSSKTYYKNIPPHAFNPIDNETPDAKYEISDYTGSLNITAYSGLQTVFMVAPVDLPQGAVVTKLTYFYYDNSPSEGMFHEAWLRRQYLPNDLPLSTMAQIPFGVSGDSSTMQSISDTTISNATIDNQNYMYMVYANYGVSGVSTGLAFYGLQIEYTMDTVAW
jgi:hypothetical protein